MTLTWVELWGLETPGLLHTCEVTVGLGYAGEVPANIEATSIRSARQPVRRISALAFLPSRPNDIGRPLDHPVILELKSQASGDERRPCC